MRALVIDHTAVLRSVRKRYVQLVKRSNVNLTLLCPHHWVETAQPVDYQSDAGETFTTVVGKVVAPGKEQRSLYLSGMLRAFRIAKPDVILMMEEPFSLFGLQIVLMRLLFAPSVPIVFYTFNVTSYNRYAYRPSIFYRVLGKIVGGYCAVGLCANEGAAQVLREARIVSDVRTLFLGIDESTFVPIDQAKARDAIGVAQDVDLFLYAGRLLFLKGIDDLIDAFVRVRTRMPERRLQLLIVGDGDYESQLHDRVRALDLSNVVTFRKTVSPAELVPIMCAATAFVLPSRTEWHEQFGRVNAEAMLLGTSIIGSTSGQIPEVIGEGGFVFPAGNVEALTVTMIDVLTNKAEVQRRKVLGREKVLREYSLTGFVDGIAGLFDELCKR